MTGYLLLTKGDASLARKGWFAITRATMEISLTRLRYELRLLVSYLRGE